MSDIAKNLGANRSDLIEIAGLEQPPGAIGIIGGSPAMRTLLDAIARFAPYSSTILITGESGAGKEVVARALHRLSPFADGPLVLFNCSNLVEGLAESQLFGHVKGAFTDAREAHPGCFRQANGGTLLLDEIGELPLGMQAKLLRVTESGEIQAVGSAEALRVNVRLLAATNRDLRAMVKAGAFRADLYYRLDVASLRVPPLRDRLDDLAPLIAHFASIHNRSFGRQVRFLSRSAFDLIRSHRWPGNVRELGHVIEHAVLFSDTEAIEPANLPYYLLDAAADRALVTAPPSQPTRGESGSPTLDDTIKDSVLRALRAARGDCAAAAQLLGISRPAIYRKMSRFGITNNSIREYRHDGPAATAAAKPLVLD